MSDQQHPDPTTGEREPADPGSPATTSSTTAGTSPAATVPVSRTQARLWRAGRSGWALLGVAVSVALLGYLLSLVPLVVIPLVLALFPATLLAPVANWLKERGWPGALAAAATIVAGILVIVGIVAAMVPLVAAELPELTDSAAEGLGDLQGLLQDGVLGFQAEGVDDVLDMAQEQLGEAGDLAGQALAAAVVAFETVAGLLLLFVILFFYLKDGRRLSEGVIRSTPGHLQDTVRQAAQQAWDTLGSYFRGQLLVAFVDAVAIGIALLVLDIPLAVPLAVLVFFGGLFPIVGAVATGALAVLVALADQGLVVGLIVLGVVLAVQQLESNVLEPYILGQAIALHPLVVLISITAGTVLMGILGAFLAVPAAAIFARVMDQLSGRAEEEPEDRAEAAQPSDAVAPGPA